MNPSFRYSRCDEANPTTVEKIFWPAEAEFFGGLLKGRSENKALKDSGISYIYFIVSMVRLH
jgi:hypothetical protein